MADGEDEAEFGSHFLDSMLEVEMTEEDSELDMSKNDDPLNTLPPIPTFDLQSETLSYKDVYRNEAPQPVIAPLPVATPNASNIPLVLKPSSMLLYSREVPPSKPVPVLTSVQKIPSKPIAKPIKNANTSISPIKDAEVKEGSEKNFLKEVFRPQFVRRVFVKAEPPSDISTVNGEEMKYYLACFKDASKVQNCRLHCTICDKHLGCGEAVEERINVHTMLQVLTCKPCFEFYGDGNFPCDKGDNCEIYCRWCGQGGALVCCSFCPSVFCKRCVKRNFGQLFLKKIEKASDWACFCCAQKPLWPHRAVCRALLEFLKKKKTDPQIPAGDTTTCCKVAGLNRKRSREISEKAKSANTSPNQSTPPKAQPMLKSPDTRNKSLPILKTRKDLFKPVVRLKANNRVKIPVNANGNSKPSAITSIFSPRSVIAGNNIIRGIATSAPGKLFSTFPSPQLIQTPVLHGETLITPPTRFLVQSKPPATPPSNSSFVRVSLTHHAPNLDMNKIPTVKIPHEVQGLVLRLIFPDNKMHYVRLASDGSGCKASKEFPMPQFQEKGASFVEENLAEAFKITKTMYEKLMRIRDKVNSRTKFTEESVFNSSVKKLHMVYEKTNDLLKELDKSLLKNHEDWKNEEKHTVDVIDISDDETTTTRKARPNRYSNARERVKKSGEDSDIEILDDVVVNGKTPSNSNYKEKYRLRSSSDHGKANSGGVVRKRKRGRLRRGWKKPKICKMQNGQPEEDPLRIETEEQVENAYNELTKSSVGAGGEGETTAGEPSWEGETNTAEEETNALKEETDVDEEPNAAEETNALKEEETNAAEEETNALEEETDVEEETNAGEETSALREEETNAAEEETNALEEETDVEEEPNGAEEETNAAEEETDVVEEETNAAEEEMDAVEEETNAVEEEEEEDPDEEKEKAADEGRETPETGNETLDDESA